MDEKNASILERSLDNPVLAATLSVVAGLFFLVLCMLLPLVGRAGAAVPYSAENHRTFLAVAVVTLAFSLLASLLKLRQRKLNGAPLPVFTLALTLLTAATILALWTGVLRL